MMDLLDQPTDLVSLRLWDVRWKNDGFGKHGNGPFATRKQAEACLRKVGWAGQVELALFTMDRAQAAQVVRRTGRPLNEFLERP